MNKALYDTIQNGDRIIIGPTPLEIATVISTHTQRGFRRNKIQSVFPHKKTIYSVFYCENTDRTYLDTRTGYIALTPEMIEPASKDELENCTIE